MEQQLDDADYYAGQQLDTIKVPLTNLPYYTNSETYQRQDGEFEIGGVIYNYVKKRIYNDSLEMVCITNKDATRLRTARNDFLRLCNDVQNASKNKKPVTAFKFFSIISPREKRPLVHLHFFNDCKSLSQFFNLPPSNYASVIENPPEHC